MATSNKPWYKRWWAFTLFIILGIGLIGSLVDDSTTYTGLVTLNPTEDELTEGSSVIEATDNVVEMEAVDLYFAYEQNEIRADNNYKDKTLLVTGVIDMIGKDILNQMFLTFYTSSMTGVVRCDLDDDQTNSAAQLNKGDKITVQGRNNGLLIQTVMLKECTIVGPDDT